MVASSGDEAVANAKRYTRCVPGMCLKYTRTWLEIPGRELDAISAWNTAKHKHSGDRKPPRKSTSSVIGRLSAGFRSPSSAAAASE